jgi:tellurite resistance protein TehA-like permease
MATGGLSLLLSNQIQPHTFRGLETIGKIVYIWDLFLFVAVTLCITYRFVRFPGMFTGSLTHPTESLMAATPFLSLASIIAAIARHGIPSCGEWLVVVYRVLFWIYFVVSFVAAVGLYYLLFTSPSLKINDMTPAWDLPIFPFMLSGTIASCGAGHQPPDQAVPMIVAGLTAQGLGMMISVLIYANYIHRMIQYGFPAPASRAGMFIAVGPPSFTSLADRDVERLPHRVPRVLRRAGRHGGDDPDLQGRGDDDGYLHLVALAVVLLHLRARVPRRAARDALPPELVRVRVPQRGVHDRDD